MDDGKSGNPTQESYMGAGDSAPDANTNFDPNLQGGPSAADGQATEGIRQQHTESRGLGSGEPGSSENGESDPARQMDNSGMKSVTGEGQDADIIGASGDDRNENR